MTEQSANSQDPALSGWPTPTPPAAAVSIGASGIRTTQNDQCPECGEHVLRQMDVCPACGGNLRQTPKQIRCVHCHTVASSELVVCPGCGRELREAPPKLLTYGAPVVLALLLAVLLVTQWHRISPVAWARTNLLRGVGMVEEISSSIEPEMVIVMTPVVEGSDNHSFGSDANGIILAAPGENIVVSDTQAVALAASEVTPVPDANGDQSGVTPLSKVAEAAESPVGIGGPEPTEQDAQNGATAESLPTMTATATDSPEPTGTATATAKATASQAGGAVVATSTQEPTPLPTWTLQATATSGSTKAALSPTPAAKVAVGGMAQRAAVAASEATDSNMGSPAEAATLAATATPVVYQIKAGDTLVTIAAKYEVEVDALMDANQISAQDVFVLQPGEMLFIPTPAPEPTPATVRVEAPELLTPPDNATVGCATGGELIWERVHLVKDSDKYVLHLGFVSGQESDGKEDVTWVLAQSGPVTQTAWPLDTSLCDLASADYDHQWRWWVEVVEDANGGTVPVSPPSPIFRFVWK